MLRIIALTTVTILAGFTVASAEDNADLPQPVYHGAVSGDAEKDTFGFDAKTASSLPIHAGRICPGQSDCRNMTAQGDPVYLGAVTGDAEKDTYGHNVTSTPDPAIELSSR